MIASDKQIKKYTIAWQGWRIPVLNDWQPMQIEGNFKKGSMIIGNSEMPIFQVSWTRLRKERNISASEWLKRRFRTFPGKLSDKCPVSAGFDDVGWVRDMEVKEGDSKSIWVGVSNTKGILIDIMFTNITPKPLIDKLVNEYLPNIEVFGKDNLWPWNLYNVTFLISGDYFLKRHHLYSGDIALEFEDKRGGTLMVRQVYPAKLALSRRSMGRWLEVYPFNQKRKYKLDKESEWNGGGENMKGFQKYGRRQIGFPFSWIRRRHCHSIIVHDNSLDRLLISEHACIEGYDSGLLLDTIMGMNKENV